VSARTCSQAPRGKEGGRCNVEGALIISPSFLPRRKKKGGAPWIRERGEGGDRRGGPFNVSFLFLGEGRGKKKKKIATISRSAKIRGRGERIEGNSYHIHYHSPFLPGERREGEEREYDELMPQYQDLSCMKAKEEGETREQGIQSLFFFQQQRREEGGGVPS